MGRTRPVEQETRHDYWLKHINRWKKNHLSQRKYCREHELSASTFSYWHRKLEKQPKAEKPRFYPLTLSNVVKAGDNDTGSGLRLYLQER